MALTRNKTVLIGTLTIANATTDSAVLSADDYSKYAAICICGPSALTGTVTIQIAVTDGATPTVTLQSPPGTDVTIGALKAVILAAKPFPQFRLHSSGAEGADRVFQIWGELASVTSP